MPRELTLQHGELIQRQGRKAGSNGKVIVFGEGFGAPPVVIDACACGIFIKSFKQYGRMRVKVLIDNEFIVDDLKDWCRPILEVCDPDE